MRKALWLSMLIPALAAGGTFVTGNAPLPEYKTFAKPCANPDATKCWTWTDANAVFGALYDLRTAFQPFVGLPPCSSGLYASDATTGKLICIAAEVCGPGFVSAYRGQVDGLRCQAVVTNPITPVTEQRLAFRGCEGSACLTTGGRGGITYTVNTLADTTGACVVNANGTTSGTCSLRDCVMGTSPRTCVFSVYGTISLTSGIYIVSPYLSVLGQTSPGGIQIKGTSTTNTMIDITTHDVVWRYTRPRRGTSNGATTDAVRLRQGAYNVVFDHNSIMWSGDETIGIYATATPAPRDVTFAWNIIAEPTRQGHITNFLSGGSTREIADTATNIDLVRNLIAHATHRNPKWQPKTGRLVNNLIYNWYDYALRIEGGVVTDIIGNKWKRGPATGSGKWEIEVSPAGTTAESPNGALSIFMSGNVGPHHPDGSTDAWSDVTYDIDAAGALSTSYKRGSALAASGTPITPIDATLLESSILPTLGASRRLDCSGNWVAARDSVDTRLVNDYTNGTGWSGISDWPAVCTGSNASVCGENDPKIGGYPTISGVAACTDTDRDGMPDAWEGAQGLNPYDPADAGLTIENQPYTNFERYANGP